MELERTAEESQVRITREGIIHSKLGSIRGINPSDSSKTTLVKYLSSKEIMETGNPDNEFIFYGVLPECIENWGFIFTETYHNHDGKGIPVSQELFAYGPNLSWKVFNFPKQ